MKFRILVGARLVGGAFCAAAVSTMTPLPVMEQEESAEEGAIEGWSA